MTLRLLRHGRTAWNDQGRYSGHADVALSPEGRAGLLPLPFATYESVVSSDLLRCRETAELLGLTPIYTAALREFDFGDLEGRRWDDLDAATRAALGDYESFVAPGGERVSDFAARIRRFVDELVDGHHLIVTHGGVIQHLLWEEGSDRRVPPGTWVDVEISRR